MSGTERGKAWQGTGQGTARPGKAGQGRARNVARSRQVISIDTEARILRLHRGGYTAQQIADKVGCCGQAVRTVISFGEIRPREEIERQREPPYTPTPQQIKDECAKIRAGWDDTTRQSRDQYPVAPWSAPLVNTPPGQFFEWTDTTNLCNNGDADDSP